MLQGEDGASLSWVRSALLERGHARDLVCGDFTDPASNAEIPAEASADWMDLWAQVMGRSMIMMGSVSRPLDDDGSWGKKSEEASRTLYLHLKADGYRALRELQTLEAAPPPAPQ